MTLIIEQADNGFIFRSPSNEDGIADTLTVVEERTSFSPVAEQLVARDVLHVVLDHLGFHFSKHGPKLHIELRDSNGDALNDEGIVITEEKS